VTKQSQNKKVPQPTVELRETPDTYEISAVMPSGVQIDQPIFVVENRVLLVNYQVRESISQPPGNYLLEVELHGPVDVTKSNGEWAPNWLLIELPKIKFEQPLGLRSQRALRNSSLSKPPTSKNPLALGKANSKLLQLPGDSGIDNLP
jgi:hypothetical protein